MLYIPWPFKRCTKCGRDLPATTRSFCRDLSKPDRLYSSCSDCRRKHNSENQETIREQRRIRRAANRDKIRENNRAYYAAHGEEMREYNRNYYHVYYAATHERQRERKASYYSANRSKYFAHTRNRRARAKRAEGRHTAKDVQRQYKAQRGKCYYCGCKVGDNYHVDHVIPLSRGGSNGPENLVVTCPSCNLSKNSKLPHEWDGNNGHLL